MTASFHQREPSRSGQFRGMNVSITSPELSIDAHPARYLLNRVALVLGGGSGLGRAIARAYLREGAAVVVGDLNEAAGVETLDVAEGRERVLALRSDVADPASTAAAVEAAVGRFGRLDVLVNCAAICLVDPFDAETPERWDRVFDLNAKGAFFA